MLSVKKSCPLLLTLRELCYCWIFCGQLLSYGEFIFFLQSLAASYQVQANESSIPDDTSQKSQFHNIKLVLICPESNFIKLVQKCIILHFDTVETIKFEHFEIVLCHFLKSYGEFMLNRNVSQKWSVKYKQVKWHGKVVRNRLEVLVKWMYS